MKLLLFNSYIHDKNRKALEMYKNVEITIFNKEQDLQNINLNTYDAIYSPSISINVSQYPNTRFIFGPHFSVFPDNNLHKIKGPNTTYIQPSEWVVNLWKNSSLSTDLNIQAVPFGVDTDKFCDILPINERTKVFVYYKSRTPDEIHFILDFLNAHKIEYILFSYTARYSEEYYLSYLRQCKYGIWVDAHESQGFALEEALSCNVPLLVWNIKTMDQEYRSTYEAISATTIPYWDERCGEYFYNKADFALLYDKFIQNIDKYSPREYILENLSIDKCETKFMNLCK
jgi:hypothetical protein